MDIDDIEELLRIDKRIDTVEDRIADGLRESLRDRWEFGRRMLAERKGGKQLPNGYLDTLAKATGKSRAELQFRMQFAERYPTEAEVSTPIGTFTSWVQVKRSLPKPGNAKPKPVAPKRHRKHEEVIDLSSQGLSRHQVAEKSGVGERQVRHIAEREAIEADAAPVIWDTIPGNQREKLDRAKASIRRELEREFRTRLLADQDQYRAACDANVATYKAKLTADAQREREARDEERQRYKLYIDVARARGLITQDDYNVIRTCLHPDSRGAVTDEKLATAFRLFNDPRIKALLVKESAPAGPK